MTDDYTAAIADVLALLEALLPCVDEPASEELRLIDLGRRAALCQAIERVRRLGQIDPLWERALGDMRF